MPSVRLFRDDIKKLLPTIKSLDRAQRDLVQETLDRLRKSPDGRVSDKELRVALSDLRKTHKISDLDVEEVMKAVFEA